MADPSNGELSKGAVARSVRQSSPVTQVIRQSGLVKQVSRQSTPASPPEEILRINVPTPVPGRLIYCQQMFGLFTERLKVPGEVRFRKYTETLASDVCWSH